MSKNDWRELGLTVTRIGLPALGAFFTTGPVGAAAAAVNAAAEVFGTHPDHPDALARAIEADPSAALKLYDLELQAQREQAKAAAEQAIAGRQAEVDALKETNATARAEILSDDWMVRRARPFFIWVMGVSWGYQMIGLTSIGLMAIWKHPEQTAPILTAMGTLIGALTAVWAVALTMVGVYFKQRSNDKARQVGLPPTGMFDLFRKQGD